MSGNGKDQELVSINPLALLLESYVQQKAMTDTLIEILEEAGVATREEIFKRFDAAMEAIQKEVDEQQKLIDKERERVQDEVMKALLEKIKPKGEA